jgi:SPP1 gp7 family putative phage head morphogenesis protein
MSEIIMAVLKDVRTNILPFLVANQREFVADASFSVQLTQLLSAVNKKYRDITNEATKIATDATTSEAFDNQRKFEKGLQQATGLDGVSLTRIVTTQGLNDVVQSQIARNVGLIQSLPDEYLKSINNIIYQSVSITKQIVEATGVSQRRAKTIARDQTAKTNALITEQRQMDLGVEEYVWQTAGDGDRVRASHRANNGKTFRWDSPNPITGHPGHDINCRCIARAVIKL